VIKNILFSLIIIFASHKLLCDVAAKDIRTCGRLQLEKNRTGRCPLIVNKDCKKQPKGSYD